MIKHTQTKFNHNQTRTNMIQYTLSHSKNYVNQFFGNQIDLVSHQNKDQCCCCQVQDWIAGDQYQDS